MVRALGICFLLSIATIAFGDSIPSKLSNYLQGIGIFEGDRHGDFSGNLVAFLSDGSAWKIHPDDTDKMDNWEIGDSVHVSLRTSFYWFKREHKFLLRNHEKGASVKVMIIEHSKPPIEVVSASGVYPTGVIVVEEFLGISPRGEPLFVEETIPCNFKKDVFLSDGTSWQIEEHFDAFDPGVPIYFGVKEMDDSCRLFLISGTEREAIWAWIEAHD